MWEGVQISEMILDGKELEFYKWDGELQDLLTAVKEKLNEVSEVRKGRSVSVGMAGRKRRMRGEQSLRFILIWFEVHAQDMK